MSGVGDEQPHWRISSSQPARSVMRTSTPTYSRVRPSGSSAACRSNSGQRSVGRTWWERSWRSAARVSSTRPGAASRRSVTPIR
ncbi:hypothetical protein NKH77_04455 [Streptomyces sp. M19]